MSSWPLRVPHTVALVGAPQQYGQPQSGVHKGPALLRAAGMRQIAAGLRWHIEDLGDVPYVGLRCLLSILPPSHLIGGGGRFRAMEGTYGDQGTNCG